MRGQRSNDYGKQQMSTRPPPSAGFEKIDPKFIPRGVLCCVLNGVHVFQDARRQQFIVSFTHYSCSSSVFTGKPASGVHAYDNKQAVVMGAFPSSSQHTPMFVSRTVQYYRIGANVPTAPSIFVELCYSSRSALSATRENEKQSTSDV